MGEFTPPPTPPPRPNFGVLRPFYGRVTGHPGVVGPLGRASCAHFWLQVPLHVAKLPLDLSTWSQHRAQMASNHLKILILTSIWPQYGSTWPHYNST